MTPTPSDRKLPRKVIIDTDPGIDDALALLLALRSPELAVQAITTVSGNVPVHQCLRNALLTLEIAGPNTRLAVARGCERPLVREPVDASQVHGRDGLGDIDQIREPDGRPRYPAAALAPIEKHGVDVILETIASHPGEITIIALGPLTNLAVAFERDSGVMQQVDEIILMGGSLSGRGNVTPVAEFNFYADPHAAQRVIRSGVKTTVVGLDVTERTLLPRDAVASRSGQRDSRPARFVADICEKYFSVHEALYGAPDCTLHDPLAVGVAIDPSFVRTERLEADVETEGRLTSGMLIRDQRRRKTEPPGNSRVVGCVDVDARRFVDSFLARVLA